MLKLNFDAREFGGGNIWHVLTTKASIFLDLLDESNWRYEFV
jgi:hypothetical protein